MNPVSSIKNQYLGVNAHLHSYWQAFGGWSRFHTNHITDIMRVMRPILLPMGYDADVEPSLQIRRSDEDSIVVTSRQLSFLIWNRALKSKRSP